MDSEATSVPTRPPGRREARADAGRQRAEPLRPARAGRLRQAARALRLPALARVVRWPAVLRPSRPTWRALPAMAAVAVALIGLALVVAGGLRATVLAPPVVTSATLLSPKQAVVSTTVGVLGLDGPRVQIVARAAGSTPVFLGIGRAADVDAYLAGVARQEVVGYDGDGHLVTKPAGTQGALPDPAGVDVWVVSNRGLGAAMLSWPDVPGQWRLVAATDGSAPAPSSLRLTWSGRAQRSSAPALISIGLVLLVGGVITLVVLVARSRIDEGPLP